MQTGDHPVNLRFSNQTFREQFSQEPSMRQFSHLHAVLGNFSFCVEGKAGSALVNRNHSQIDVRTEPAIQFKLALAKVTALFQSVEIEKPEVHGLLDLENKWRSNEDPRDVGLQRAHFGRAVRIRLGRFEKSNQPLLGL